MTRHRLAYCLAFTSYIQSINICDVKIVATVDSHSFNSLFVVSANCLFVYDISDVDCPINQSSVTLPLVTLIAHCIEMFIMF